VGHVPKQISHGRGMIGKSGGGASGKSDFFDSTYTY
jgi:hypothetical protein